MSDFDYVTEKIPLSKMSDEQLANALNFLLENMRANIEQAQSIMNDQSNTIQDKMGIMMKFLMLLNEQTYNNLDSFEQLITKKAKEEQDGQE